MHPISLVPRLERRKRRAWYQLLVHAHAFLWFLVKSVCMCVCVFTRSTLHLVLYCPNLLSTLADFYRGQNKD